MDNTLYFFGTPAARTQKSVVRASPDTLSGPSRAVALDEPARPVPVLAEAAVGGSIPFPCQPHGGALREGDRSADVRRCGSVKNYTSISCQRYNYPDRKCHLAALYLTAEPSALALDVAKYHAQAYDACMNAPFQVQ